MHVRENMFFLFGDFCLGHLLLLGHGEDAGSLLRILKEHSKRGQMEMRPVNGSFTTGIKETSKNAALVISFLGKGPGTESSQIYGKDNFS